MNIISANRLNNMQLKDVETLLNDCRQAEQLEGICLLDSRENELPDFPCFYLLYEDDFLISFISVFIPFCSQAEVYAYTHPSMRNKGFFKLLFNETLSKLNERGITQLYFCIETNSLSGKITMEHLRTSLQYSECVMKYDTSEPLSLPQGSLRCKSTFKDDTFTLSYNVTSSDPLRDRLYSPHRTIGKCKIDTSKQCATIYSFNISKNYQGKGYGTEMLLQTIQYLLEHDYMNILLHVTSTNQPAYSLYLKNNFRIITQIDYYKY